jgi:tetratricopeptide (TPR) repeat protein
MKQALIPFLVSFILPFSIFSQGINIEKPASTWAVVIGISDYQDVDIPDLKFANKDAEAFANFLRSPAGGSLDADHLQLLINEEATSGKVGSALIWLVEEAKEGDKVIIYFSGHGDVEQKLRGQPGFLLCWDSPPRVYFAGGVIQLGMLQSIISTLSLDNKSNVTVITDACRSGKLAGSGIGGSQLTNSNLLEQYAQEVKILSCQPNEYSIEGFQWGGGRGAFSYHLLDGLYGMADTNEDLVVDLREIRNYLEEKVGSEVAPQSQLPITVGSGREELFKVMPEILIDIEESKKGQMQVFAAIETKGIEESALSQVDEATQGLYHQFQTALIEKNFLEPVGECADAYYEQLLQIEGLESLRNSMRRNYAAALQDDAQQALNKWLKIDPDEIKLSTIVKRNKYRTYPQNLERAAELLGKRHYMYSSLIARKLFFEGFLLSPKADRDKIIANYKAALDLEPNLPHVYFEMIDIYGEAQVDSAEYYTEQASKIAPTWIMPYVRMARIHYFKTENFERAKFYLDKAEQYAPNSVIFLNKLGIYLDAVDKDDEAATKYLKAIEMDPDYWPSYTNLGKVYGDQRKFKKAEKQFLKVTELDPDNVIATTNLSIICIYLKRYDDAEKYSKKVIELDPGYYDAYFSLACIYGIQNKVDLAYEYLIGAFENGGKDYEWLQSEADLNSVRNQKERWDKLMAKYFPEKINR